MISNCWPVNAPAGRLKNNPRQVHGQGSKKRGCYFAQRWNLHLHQDLRGFPYKNKSVATLQLAPQRHQRVFRNEREATKIPFDYKHLLCKRREK